MGPRYNKMFDLNHDGKIDAAEFAYEMDYLESEERVFEDNDYEDIDAETLDLAGIDPDELEFMDDSEIAEAFEDAGLDIGDFDF